MASLLALVKSTEDFSKFEWVLRRQMGSPPELDGSQISLAIPASVAVLKNSYQHAGTDRHDYRPPTERLRYGAHWLRVFNEGADFEVTDPRDKVYGVLGIITSPTARLYVESRPNIQSAEFPISYTKSVSEVYQDVVKHLINLNRNLDAIQIFEDRRNRAKDLPSWATDWRQSTRRSIMQCARDDMSERKRIGEAPTQNLNDIGSLRLRSVHIGGSLKGLTIRSRPEMEADISPQPEPDRMDSHYLEWIRSDYFVSGTGWYEPKLLTEHSKISVKAPDSEGPRVLVPREARLDDILVALLGSSCLFLVRPLPQDEYEFLGPVIRNFRDLPDWSRVTMQTFTLV
jgi:hypothetical protein